VKGRKTFADVVRAARAVASTRGLFYKGRADRQNPVILAPMPNLQSRLNQIAQSFASAVLEAVRGTSLQDLHAATGGGAVGNGRRARPATSAPTTGAVKPTRSSGRLPRRSPEDIAKALDQIIALVKRKPEGLRAEQIRKELGLLPKEMPRVLKEGVSKKALRTKGQKRATTYFAK
jgi:hypothetical protein